MPLSRRTETDRTLVGKMEDRDREEAIRIETLPGPPIPERGIRRDIMSIRPTKGQNFPMPETPHEGDKVHYTISKDSVGESTKDKLAAIVGKKQSQGERLGAHDVEENASTDSDDSYETLGDKGWEDIEKRRERRMIEETEQPSALRNKYRGKPHSYRAHTYVGPERESRTTTGVPQLPTPTLPPISLPAPSVPTTHRRAGLSSDEPFTASQKGGGALNRPSPSASVMSRQKDSEQSRDGLSDTQAFDGILFEKQLFAQPQKEHDAINSASISDGQHNLGPESEDGSEDFQDETVDEEDELTGDEGEGEQFEEPPRGGGASLNKRDAPMTMIAEMKQRILELENRNRKLSGRDPNKISVQVFHRLRENSEQGSSGKKHRTHWYDAAYLTEPSWDVHGDRAILKSQLPVADPEEYEEDNYVTFSIYQVYDPEHQQHAVLKAVKTKSPLPSPTPVAQHVRLVSGEMRRAFQSLCAQFPDVIAELKDAAFGRILESPFVWWYHYRAFFNKKRLRPRHRDLVLTLTKWLDLSYDPLYDSVRSQFSRGRVSAASLPFLIRAGDVVVSNYDGTLQGHICQGKPEMELIVVLQESEGHPIINHSYKLKVRAFSYAGDIFWKEETVVLSFKTKTEDEEILISSLSHVPISFVRPEDLDALRQRGAMFWKCRKKQYVSYEGDVKNRKHTVCPDLSVTVHACCS